LQDAVNKQADQRAAKRNGVVCAADRKIYGFGEIGFTSAFRSEAAILISR
jgi:hypothetical protein